MKIFGACLVLFTVSVCQVGAREFFFHSHFNWGNDGLTVTPLENRGGWVDPEDLTPMPQCIAQQDQSAWLNAMTRCTSKRCTRHFGIICTRHQWLTELDCLSIEFSPDVIKDYFSYCSRSVLAKAQLYYWVRNNAGRMWLVDVGDTNELRYLSPDSLVDGYVTMDVIQKAPMCLTNAISASSLELFRYVMASCSFGGATEHTGNAARPWEYNEGLHSMIALDFETVGYDLTGRRINYGDYFDKKCFCSTFTINSSNEPCSEPGELDLTKERLWMNAICGPTSLPEKGLNGLRTTEFAYIPIRDWRWPTCVTDMPRQLTELPEQCANDACKIDSDGFCNVVRAVDRACFCREIKYDSCGGSCHVFETRINYVQWLHSLCGNVQGWRGLPDHWQQLAAPTSSDLIPWEWTLRPANIPGVSSIRRSGSIKAAGSCASTEWKLRSFALVNMATFLGAFLTRGTSLRQIARHSSWDVFPQNWVSKGIWITGVQIFANYLNALVIQNTRGYEEVSAIDLILFWCLMPRLTWLTVSLIGAQYLPFDEMKSTVTSLLLSEAILQVLSLYYMFTTISYGLEHYFYFGGLEGAERATQARYMYVGALIWLLVIMVALVVLVQATWKTNELVEDESSDIPHGQTSKPTTSTPMNDLVAPLNNIWTRFEEQIARRWIDGIECPDQTPLLRSEGTNYRVYGTYRSEALKGRSSQNAFTRLIAVGITSMLLLWIAQWLFWAGFIGISLEAFCPPKLGLLTVVWIVSSLTSIAIAFL